MCGAPTNDVTPFRGLLVHTMSIHPATLASVRYGGLTGEITKTGLSRPPRWNEATGVITPQGPHSTPVRPPVLRTPLPVSYLEEGPLERVVLGRGMCPPIPRAKRSHPVCLSIGRLRHALGTGYVPSRCLPANQSTHPGRILVYARRRSKAAPIPPSLWGARPTHRPPNRQCRLGGSLASGPN